MEELLKINLMTLPSWNYADRKQLPNTAGLYFIFHKNHLMYIGKSVNFNQRHKYHCKKWYFEQFPENRIAILELDVNQYDLENVEKVFIGSYMPTLNWSHKPKYWDKFVLAYLSRECKSLTSLAVELGIPVDKFKRAYYEKYKGKDYFLSKDALIHHLMWCVKILYAEVLRRREKDAA